MDISTLAICGISLVSIIQITVGLAKKLGFPTKYCPHLSAGLGLIGGITIAIIGGQPIYYGIIAGIVGGATACGVYDQATGKITASTTV